MPQLHFQSRCARNQCHGNIFGADLLEINAMAFWSRRARNQCHGKIGTLCPSALAWWPERDARSVNNDWYDSHNRVACLGPRAAAVTHVHAGSGS